MAMNFRDLKYLVKIDEVKSFTQAAKSLFVSQSNLSVQVKKIEKDLGVTIFERDNNSVLTTKTGEKIVEKARNILLDFEEMRRFAKNSQDIFAGNFVVGGCETLASYYFSKFSKKVARNFEKLNLFLLEEKSQKLLEMLKNGEMDAAFMTMPVADDEIVGQVIFSEPFYLAVSEDNRFACRDSISLKDLYGEKIMLLGDGHCMRDSMIEVCKMADALEFTDFAASSLETLRQMARIGAGITFMPEIAMRKNDGVVYVRIEGAPRREIGLFWREGYYREKLMDEVVKVLV